MRRGLLRQLFGSRDVRSWIFRHRGALPIPFLVLAGLYSHPTYIPMNLQDFLFDLASLALIGLGLFLRIWAVGYAIQGTRIREAGPQAKALITAGPYAYVRNPIYLGNFLLGLGVCMLLENWVIVGAFLVLYRIMYGAIVSLEEEFLYRQFGQTYTAYARKVPRWLPRRLPVSLREFRCLTFHKEYQTLALYLALFVFIETWKHLPRGW